MTSQNQKPVEQLQAFLGILGWTALRINQHAGVDKHGVAKFNPPITWYECGITGTSRRDFFLQVNEHPQGQVKTYQAAVYAVRYRIWTGWRSFSLPARKSAMQREAMRLAKWLDFGHFDTLDHRGQFRRKHPECMGYTWKKIVNGKPPNEA